MRKKLAMFGGLIALVQVVVPSALLAAGPKAVDLVVVADTRILSGGMNRYFADLYNTDILIFAVWAVALTALQGCVLGYVMDKIMGATGLDLTKRKIVEH